MSNDVTGKFKSSPFSTVQYLVTALLILVLSTGLDVTYYVACVVLLTANLLYSYYHTRYVDPSATVPGMTIAYIITWLLATAFDSRQGVQLTPWLKVGDLELITITCVLVAWTLNTSQKNPVFGYSKATGVEEMKKNLWRVTLFLIVIIQYSLFDTYRSLAQWSILVPISLDMYLNRRTEEQPTLSLNPLAPLFTVFHLQIVIARNLSIILLAYLAELLTDKMWLLVMLVIVLIGTVTTALSFGLNLYNYFAQIEKETKEKVEEVKEMGASGLGRAARQRMRAPRYSIYKILKELDLTDFRDNLYIVEKPVKIRTREGLLHPPRSLLIMPVELSRFDEARGDEVLLLGLLPRGSGEGIPKFTINTSDVELSGNTLVVKRKTWETLKQRLKKVEESDDLSQYGLDDLKTVQEQFLRFKEKTIEVGRKVQRSIFEFVGGFLVGVEDGEEGKP